MNPLAYKYLYRKNLPHIQPPGATLFVTFRLAGSIPAAVQQQLLEEARWSEKALERVSNSHERARQAYLEQRRIFGKWDAALDASASGPHWLGDPRVAQLVVDSLHHRDGHVFELDTFCVMSNHVHVVFTPLSKEDGTCHALPAIMHSLKRYTAHQANLLLGRQGQFWQHESYDHVVRDEAELLRIRRYVLNNPVRAGLVQQWDEWPWMYCKHM